MLLSTLVRELTTPERFTRVPEPDLIMDSGEAVAAFLRAGQPNGILSGVHAFYIEQACRMIRPGDRVLDLGCGPAQLLASIAALNPDAHFAGIDFSAPMIAAGQGVATPNLHLAIDDMTQLSTVERGSMDVVLSSMALHHLPDTERLGRCFRAIERVLAPNGRIFVSDFGRLKSMRSVEYFVRRAIPSDEPQLEQDYRASLHAAFSKDEFRAALSNTLQKRLSMYSTIVSPMMIALMTPFPDEVAPGRATPAICSLPRARRADYRQLRWCLRLGGMPC